MAQPVKNALRKCFHDNGWLTKLCATGSKLHQWRLLKVLLIEDVVYSNIIKCLRSNICLCPFNPQHRIPKEGLQKHIIKCKVNYPEHEVCPYNALHRFLNKDKFVEHLLSCPNKKLGIMEFLHKHEEGGDLSKPSTEIDNVRKINLQYENWDKV